MPIKANYAYSFEHSSLPILQTFMWVTYICLYMVYSLCTCGVQQTIPCFFVDLCLVPVNTWHLQLSQSVPRIFSSFMALFAFTLGDLKQISEDRGVKCFYWASGWKKSTMFVHSQVALGTVNIANGRSNQKVGYVYVCQLKRFLTAVSQHCFV